MTIPSEEQLELDLQNLANYERFKRLGSFPEIYFVIGVSGAAGDSGGGDNGAIEAILAEIRDRLGSPDEVALPASLSADGRLKTESAIRKLTVADDKVGVVVEQSVLPDGAASNYGLQQIQSAVIRQGYTQDYSGIITVGGTAQLAVPLNPNRRYLFIQNTSLTDILWFNFGSVDASPGSPSIKLNPDADFTAEAGFIPSDAVTVFGSVTGQPFTIKQNFEG